jgi:hypothetical protein
MLLSLCVAWNGRRVQLALLRQVELELNNNFCNFSVMKWAGHVARMGAKMNACRILVGKSEGKRPLGRPRRSWADNIEMDLREIGWDDVDWIDIADN